MQDNNTHQNQNHNHKKSQSLAVDITPAVAPNEISEIDLYQKREKIYKRSIQGFYQRIRLYSGWPLLLLFFLTPWFNWGDQQSIFFDLPHRKFHIFGLTFWPQDFILLAFSLIIAAFGLFLITVIAGRIWCGYTCPQTVWTSIFMWIEQHTEGTRNQRIKLDAAPWSTNKVLRKGAKHTMWVGVSFATAFAFVSYFYPAREMIVDLASLNLNAWAAFWLGFFTWCTYINAGWLREQVCMYMCPYARFQSVMFDKDTLIVAYDVKRGEPRGSRKKSATKNEHNLGDCINCNMCVQVCPTGIDIRNGLQIECIGCALCIDACDSVMDQMQYPKGLIRYTSETELSGGQHKWLRPRLIGYGILLFGMIGFLLFSLFNRPLIDIEINKERKRLYETTSEGYVQNIYRLTIMNKDTTDHDYEVSIDGFDYKDDMDIIGKRTLHVKAGEIDTLALRLQIDPGLLQQTSSKITFVVKSTNNGKTLSASEQSSFIAPRVR